MTKIERFLLVPLTMFLLQPELLPLNKSEPNSIFSHTGMQLRGHQPEKRDTKIIRVA